MRTSRASRRRCARAPRRRRRASGAALSHLRLGRRRQVDLDRPPALRAEPHLRRSSGRARARFEEARHHRRRRRFRPAARRAGSRARAGHHHRRRLPLFRHDAARLRRRRHAGPRAIYPQHGDRRLQCRPRRAAGRRAQGPAEPDPPPRHHRQPARHPPRRAGGEQDRSRRLRSGRVRARSPPSFRRLCRRARLQGHRRRSRSRRATATMFHRAASARPGMPGRICSTISKRSTSRTSAPASRSACRCNGSTGRNSDFRGFAGTIASGSVKAGDEIAILPSGQTSQDRSDHRRRRRSRRARRRGDAVTVTLADEIDVARGDMLAALRDRPQVADQFAAHLVWMASEQLLPGRSYLMKINNCTRRGDRHRAQAPARRQHAGEACRQDAGAERGRRLQSVGRPAGRRSMPMPTTATPAPSS